MSDRRELINLKSEIANMRAVREHELQRARAEGYAQGIEAAAILIDKSYLADHQCRGVLDIMSAKIRALLQPTALAIVREHKAARGRQSWEFEEGETE